MLREIDAALQDSSVVPILLSNGVLAFGLNLSVFLLIGKTSALSMNVAGIVKDWCLIGLSVFIFGAQVGANLFPLQRRHHGSLPIEASARGLFESSFALVQPQISEGFRTPQCFQFLLLWPSPSQHYKQAEGVLVHGLLNREDTAFCMNEGF